MSAQANAASHPNEIDLRRILRLLEKRKRYQYVSPSVQPDIDGYRIVSPCCSRNIDRDGGLIDIARIEYDEGGRIWTLYRKDHPGNMWTTHMRARQLHQLLDCLNVDSERVFWR